MCCVIDEKFTILLSRSLIYTHLRTHICVRGIYIFEVFKLMVLQDGVVFASYNLDDSNQGG